MTRTKNFKCGQCANGVVKMVIRETSTTLDVTMKNCDKCKASYGLKGVDALEEIKPNTSTTEA